MRRAVLAALPLVVFAGLVSVFAMSLDRDPDLVPSVLLDRPAPDVTLTPVTGLDLPGFSRAELTAGRVSVVNVFASWCVPCRDEHPYLMELAEAGEVAIYGINHKDAPENARAFLAGLGNPYDAVGGDADGRASIEWGVYGVPETFVVAPDGTVTYKHIGPLTERSYRESLLPAIAAAAGE